MESVALLGGLSYQQFLDEYWQQKPLLIRQALPGIKPMLSAEELAGLSMEEDVSSRIIIEQGETPWQIKYPPFSDEDFLQLPETHWTLLVNDLEQYLPELQALLQHFRFIPDWRIDDLMVSYAADGGSVGPHVDEYDVFLIQLEGKRRWQLDPAANLQNILPDLQLKILQEFNAEQDWVLEAGDMLYLPPNLAHYGVAQGACMTYSVGFRSPSQRDMLESWLGKLADSPATLKRYKDAKRDFQVQAGELSAQDVDRLKTFLLEAIQQDDDALHNWLGSFLTESKHARDLEYDDSDAFDIAQTYFRSSACRLAWIQEANTLKVFIAGDVSAWKTELLPLVNYLADHYEYDSVQLDAMARQSNKGRHFLDYVVKAGLIYCE